MSEQKEIAPAWGHKAARPRGTDHAQVIQVIQTKALTGIGSDEDPCRYIFQYWDFEGNLLAEKDLI